jgi:hypothetical protein
MQECLDLSNESNEVAAFLGKPRRARLKRPGPALHFLTRARPLRCEVRLVPERFSSRRALGELFRASLAQKTSKSWAQDW